MSATPKRTRLGDAARHLRCVSALRNATQCVTTLRCSLQRFATLRSAPLLAAPPRITLQRNSTAGPFAGTGIPNPLLDPGCRKVSTALRPAPRRSASQLNASTVPQPSRVAGQRGTSVRTAPQLTALHRAATQRNASSNQGD